MKNIQLPDGNLRASVLEDVNRHVTRRPSAGFFGRAGSEVDQLGVIWAVGPSD
ncbi:hypothetical protein OOK41_12515 [Micromonospora sp. NBC_01655]|uniref:hypothetical protein n=1 Tax=unclassified Micromonospora TaxID=2617518 RepID=UPI001404D12E|nr:MULTISPECIES: hypothetical protein [unclassified Micromonospora]MCX4471123.1 hypothetical protein [Micromonospora sp. NBC_01655]